MKKLQELFGTLDFSATGHARVIALTIVGTLVCITVAFAIDGYSFEEGWRWGSSPINNLIIPLVLAPPFFYFLLSKLRELALAHRELMIVSMTDSLTSCFNRRAFTAIVDRYLARMETTAEGKDSALLVIDIDHFKSVNDSFGHDIGDKALILIAETIRKNVRDSDAVGRIGGEEFGVFLPSAGPALTHAVAERIRTAVNAVKFNPAGNLYPLSVSVGGTMFTIQSTFGELYRMADQKLYDAKRNGRNRVEIVPAQQNNAPVRELLH